MLMNYKTTVSNLASQKHKLMVLLNLFSLFDKKKKNSLPNQFLPEFHAWTGENSILGMVGIWAWEREH